MGRSKSEPRLCGAKTRSGGSCRAYAARNARNGRCRLHGGKAAEAQRANSNKLRTRRKDDRSAQRDHLDKAGGDDPPPYSSAVLPGESSLFDALPVGSVDDELKLCRLRLSRAAAAEAKLIASGETEGLSRIQDEINRITARIERFESRRSQLIALASAAVATGAVGGDMADDPRQVAEAIRTALAEIDAVTAPGDERSDDDADA